MSRGPSIQLWRDFGRRQAKALTANRPGAILRDDSPKLTIWQGICHRQKRQELWAARCIR